MSELFMNSGGLIVMHEEFSDRIFKESFKKVHFGSFRFTSPQLNKIHINLFTPKQLFLLLFPRMLWLMVHSVIVILWTNLRTLFLTKSLEKERLIPGILGVLNLKEPLLFFTKQNNNQLKRAHIMCKWKPLSKMKKEPSWRGSSLSRKNGVQKSIKLHKDSIKRLPLFTWQDTVFTKLWFNNNTIWDSGLILTFVNGHPTLPNLWKEIQVLSLCLKQWDLSLNIFIIWGEAILWTGLVPVWTR